MNKKEQTIKTYNDNAKGLAEKFNDSGIRKKDVDEVFALLKKGNPVVLEIGCANGRDAKEILKHTNQYLGLDVSEKLIEIAKEEIPNGEFIVADIEEYEFPENLDIVFAFASLIHNDREALKKVFQKVYAALNPGGLFRISMKQADEYVELTKDTPYGIRTYYHYSEDDIMEMAKDFKIIKADDEVAVAQNWLEFLFQKV
jgi:SAM-dependent methyltransferase